MIYCSETEKFVSQFPLVETSKVEVGDIVTYHNDAFKDSMFLILKIFKGQKDRFTFHAMEVRWGKSGKLNVFLELDPEARGFRLVQKAGS